MKRRLQIVLLSLPLLLMSFFMFMIGGKPSFVNDPASPSVVPAKMFSEPTRPVPPSSVSRPSRAFAPHPREEESQPVVTFVQGAPYEKIFALLDQHRDHDAIELLEAFLKTHPGDLQAYALLGKLYYERDQLDEAIAAWEKVFHADPENTVLKANLDRARREKEAQAGFTRAATRHFTIKFEGAESRFLYQTVLGILEEAYGTVGRALQFYPDQEVIVLLYTDQQFFDVTRAPTWTRGVYDGKIRIPTKGFEEQLNALKPILVHEYVHAVVHQMTLPSATGERVAVPTWLNEGMAQYLSLSEGSETVHNRVRAWRRRGAFIPLSELHGSFMGLDSLHAAVAYDESYSAVAYLVDTFGLWRVKRIIEALVHPHTGNVTEAVRSALLIPYDQFQSQWEETLVR